MLKRSEPPKEIAAVLDLQASNGQWRLGRRLYHALGHSNSTIPTAPEGVKDGRWATALAVIFLRRRPDVIDCTFEAYSRAIAWVDEPLLAEAHKRLSPADLYYPVDDEASRQGLWQENARETLDEYGYAYFLPQVSPADREDDEKDSSDNLPNVETPYPGVDGMGNTIARTRAVRPATVEGSGPVARRKAAAEREALKQSQGLRSELKRAIRMARKTFGEGDSIESRWRRPTRLDKPRLDPEAWHPGRLIAVDKNGNVDIVFEDGEQERLSGVPAKHVRLAPAPSEPPRSTDHTLGHETPESSAPPTGLCSASRRKLAHIESAAKSIRSTWEEPMTMDQELGRLNMLREEKMRGRPEWRASFPATHFEVAKRIPIGDFKAGWGGAQQRRSMRQRRQARDTARRRRGRPSRVSSLPDQLAVDTARETLQQDTRGEGCATNGRADTSITCSALAQAQFNLVKAAMAYDRCVVGVRDCLDRGVAAFRVAQTYSEQQRAFDESTASIGPAQPARAGYTDWRGRPVVGLQNATLDVAEAMDAWAVEWVVARNEAVGSQAIKQVVKAPPFMWEGLPLASTIVGHSAKLLGAVPEIEGWYGPGFTVRRNPFFLTYPIDDRPVTPRNALVRAYVNGEMVTTVSPMLLQEREKEELAFAAVLDQQAAAPSWWPAAKGAMSEAHYARVRRAEKVLLREDSHATAGAVRGDTRQRGVKTPPAD